MDYFLYMLKLCNFNISSEMLKSWQHSCLVLKNSLILTSESRVEHRSLFLDLVLKAPAHEKILSVDALLSGIKSKERQYFPMFP